MLESLRSIRHKFINCFERKKNNLHASLLPDVCSDRLWYNRSHCLSTVPQLLGGGGISLLGKATLATKAAQQPIY